MQNVAGKIVSLFATLILIGCESYKPSEIAQKQQPQPSGSQLEVTASTGTQKIFVLETNIGPVPVEEYLRPNTGSILVGCPANRTVRDCLKDNIRNYAAQGVTAVRYMFDLNGAAFLASGAPNPEYIANLTLIHQDIKASGISKIIPTPNWDGWGQEQLRTVFDPCQNQNVQLYFYRASPLPFDTVNKYPYALAEDRSYQCAPANPIFVGWNNIYSLLDSVIKSAKDSGLHIPQFDIRNEVNLHWFSIMGRMVYDIRHSETGNPNVYMSVRAIMKKYGFSEGSVNYSTVASNVSQANFDCNTAYGDSGRLISQSALAAAIAGQPFGRGQGWSVSNKIICGGNKQGMAQSPVSNPLPDIYDIHDYHCIETANGTCDASKGSQIESDSLVFYNGLASFLNRLGKPQGVLAIGETHSLIARDSQVSCEFITVPSNVGTQMVNAMTRSALSTSNGRTADSNIIRPWNYIMDGSNCYQLLHNVAQYQNFVPAGGRSATDSVLPTLLASSYAHPEVVSGYNYAILKGVNLNRSGNNTVVSSCGGIEKVYDGADGGGDPTVTQINVRLPAASSARTCDFRVQDPSGAFSNLISIDLPQAPMMSPLIFAAGGGCGGCDCAWMTGANFYPGAMEVHIRKGNWDYVTQATTVNVIHENNPEVITLAIPQQAQSYFASEGLRFTVVNTLLNSWYTSDVVRCQ